MRRQPSRPRRPMEFHDIKHSHCATLRVHMTEKEGGGGEEKSQDTMRGASHYVRRRIVRVCTTGCAQRAMASVAKKKTLLLLLLLVFWNRSIRQRRLSHRPMEYKSTTTAPIRPRGRPGRTVLRPQVGRGGTDTHFSFPRA